MAQDWTLVLQLVDGCMRRCCAGATLSFVSRFERTVFGEARLAEALRNISTLVAQTFRDVVWSNPIAISWSCDSPSRLFRKEQDCAKGKLGSTVCRRGENAVSRVTEIAVRSPIR